MKVNIISIGNSRGIRIPKAVLEKCGFEDSAEIAVEKGRIVLSPVVEPRAGWDAAFEAMAAHDDDRLFETPPTEFDESEWQW